MLHNDPTLNHLIHLGMFMFVGAFVLVLTSLPFLLDFGPGARQPKVKPHAN